MFCGSQSKVATLNITLKTAKVGTRTHGAFSKIAAYCI